VAAMRSLNLRNRIGSRAIGPNYKPVDYLPTENAQELIGPMRGPRNPKSDRLRLAALQPNALANSRLGSIASSLTASATSGQPR
jgi:hypothetical protein